MSELSQKRCEACHAGAPKATAEEIANYMQILPDWSIIQDDGMDKLTRTFTFTKFPETMAFVNKVAEIAEEEGHHPVMLVEFRQATVYWWTHKIGGLHENDFIMAAKTDAL